ncbi:MAG: NADH-ubiquinone oxidoreductase-F iron-sulfur binding region domain-containing protein [Ilumatobacteraceae bacterium]
MITGPERTAIESVLGPRPERDVHDVRGGHAVRGLRHLLLPTLHAVNDQVGWLGPSAADEIADRLGLGAAEVFGVASFYSLFSTAERDPVQRHVCVDLACRANGWTEASVDAGAHPSACLGVCERGRGTFTIEAGPEPYRFVDPEPPVAAAVPLAGSDDAVLLRRVGRIDPTSIDDHIAHGGFAALDRARELGPEGIIEAVRESGLTGRGGAAFPTAVKWEAVRTQAATPHHLVCNADESEPGTFKDRTILENDPFTVVEAIMIAAIAVGAERAHVYLRGEYPRAEAALLGAIDQCRRRGILGDDIDIVVVRGAGAYICGEETAIFNSIEGYRGEPRNKPPFPFQSGLFGLPTAVNNVETLINVPAILRGELPVANRRLFCVSGAVVRPGVYEIELGPTLRDLIDLAGGLRAGSELQAVLLGGAAGGFAGPDDLDLPLTPEAVRAVGLTLGSGVVMVHDQHVDLVDQLRRIAAFFRDESCGQCVPCRIGTVRQQETIDRIVTGSGDRQLDLALLRDIGRAMRDASICGLGQTAHSAIETAIVRLGVLT